MHTSLPALLIALLLVGCSDGSAQSSVQSQTGARDQIRAMNAECIARIVQAQKAGAAPAQLAQMRAQCIANAKQLLAPEAESRLANDRSLFGITTRATLAARAAEKAGNYPEMLRQYQSIDANAEAILTAVPQQRMTDTNSEDLFVQLLAAERKIGVYEERRGNYAEAARSYQKGLDIARSRQGVDPLTMVRFGFLYANGLGVPHDEAKARALFDWRPRNELTEGNVYLDLMDVGMLPKSPEGITPELLAEAGRRMTAAMRSLVDHFVEQYHQSHPNGPPREKFTTETCIISSLALPMVCG